MKKLLTEEDSLRYESSVKDYFILMKPRVAALVVFTSFTGMILERSDLHPLIAFVAMLCVFAGAGSAASVNMWYDRDIDSLMLRTRGRPTVTGKILPEEALSFGIVTGCLSVAFCALCVNVTTSILLGLSILYYVFVYTIWLKRSSPQNVVIGGVSGALPPIIGAAAATGHITVQSILWFLIIFAWTPPHSWALSILKSDDYGKAGIPMMNLTEGEYVTKKLIMLYSVLLFFVSSLPFFFGFSSYIYLAWAIFSGLGFLYKALLLFRSKEKLEAKKLFFYSIFYLAALFFVGIIDKFSSFNCFSVT